jgi:P4 family phage/plasmid primase-like protien
MTIGTLKHYAKIDNRKEYDNIINQQIKPHIENSLNGSHNDIAKALVVKYGEEFKCGSIDYKRWYRYHNNCWNKIEDGRDLRMKISEEIYNEYKKIGKEISDKLMDAQDEGERAMYTTRYKQVLKIMKDLKSSPFKGHVMKEAKDLFYEQNFSNKLDSNPWIIGCQNGIYDLKNNQFRKEGIPSDYVSMKLGVKYNDKLSETDPMVQEVYDFLEKVFPDRSVREYFLDTSSDVFVGGNPNKLVQVWSGDGDNAKSVTQTLFEKMMGDYSIKLPTSLIVGKRTQSSAACPELVRAGNGVRWAVLQEPDAKDVINIGILKELSGNDTFFARGLYKEGSEITPMFKLVLICNEPPKLPYSDKATWNRIRVIPFEATFCDDAPETLEEQMLEKRFPKDPHFSSKIPAMTEAFFWVLINHRKNMKRRFEPEKVKMATAQYKKKNDIYRQFIDECTVQDDTSNIRLLELYNQFKEWFRDSMPNHQLPIKNEVKEYFLKVWGEPGKGCQWNGYRIRTMQDDIDNEDETVVLEEGDLVEYNNNDNGVPNL